MNRRHTFLLGFTAGVAFSVLGYFAVFYEHSGHAVSGATTTAAPERSLSVMGQKVTVDNDQLSGLATLPLRAFEEKLGLAPGCLDTAGKGRPVRDQFVVETPYAGCDRVVAFPVNNSANYLVIGILYGHVHVVSLFAPRWADSESTQAPLNEG